MMKRLYTYLFVTKDPVLMAMPWRRQLGAAMITQGFIFVGIGIIEITGGI